MSTTDPALARLLVDTVLLGLPDAPVAAALDHHRRTSSGSAGALVHSLAVPDVRMPELLETLASPEDDPLPVTLSVTGGAGALAPALRWTADPRTALAAVHTTLRDPGDLAGNARRVTTAVDQLWAAGALGPEVPVYVEPPPPEPDAPGGPGHGWLAALDELAALELRLAVRTLVAGEPALSPDTLAGCLAAALDRELPVAVLGDRPAAPALLLAVRASLDGLDTQEVAAVLAEPAARTAERWAATDPAALGSARRWLPAVGVADLPAAAQELACLGPVAP